MKTLLQILPSLEKTGGGVEKGTLDIAKEASAKGFNSVIISSGGDMAEKYRYKGVSHYKLSLKKKNIFNYFFLRNGFNRLLDKLKPDIVHIRSRWPAFCFNDQVIKRNIPLVTTYHGTYSGNNFLLKKNYNRLMTQGDRVIAISAFIFQHILKNFPECVSRLRLVNRGIDTEYFSLTSVKQFRKESFLKNLSIEENKHIILLPGRLTSWKGQMIAIEAAKIISETRPDIDFLMLLVGSEQSRTGYLNLLKQKINKHNLQSKVLLVGNRQDMPAIYSISDLVLSTSIEPEAFGRVSAEASSMSKPIIGSKIGATKDIIVDNHTGWLVKENDSFELANKILDVFNKTQKEKDFIGINARRRVIEKYSLKKMLNTKLSLYEELLSRKEYNDN